MTANPNEFESGGYRYDAHGRRIIAFRELNSAPRNTDKPEGGTMVDGENRELVVGFEPEGLFEESIFEKITVIGSSGIIARLEQLANNGNLALSVHSVSETNHAATLNMAATKGIGAAVNIVSSNPEFSASEISGKETGHGTLKISHVNPEAGATADQNAAAISIDLQGEKGVVGKPTAAQGIFLTSTTGENTGAWFTVRNTAKELLARIKSTGVLEFKEVAGSPTGVETECWTLYVKEKKLFIKLASGAATEVTSVVPNLEFGSLTFGKGFSDHGGSFIARNGKLVTCAIYFDNLAQPLWSAGTTYASGALVRTKALPSSPAEGAEAHWLFESLQNGNKANAPDETKSTAFWARTEGNLIDSLPVGFRPATTGIQDSPERIFMHTESIVLDKQGATAISSASTENLPILLSYKAV